MTTADVSSEIDVYALMFPEKLVVDARVADDPTFQNTLQGDAPFAMTIFELTDVVRAVDT